LCRAFYLAPQQFARHDRRWLSGVAPSNFGAALGYGAVSVDASATSHALIADSRSTAAH
jgi:hypothetical protein